MECKNPVGESPTSCALVLFEKSNLMHQRKNATVTVTATPSEGYAVECVTTLR